MIPVGLAELVGREARRPRRTAGSTWASRSGRFRGETITAAPPMPAAAPGAEPAVPLPIAAMGPADQARTWRVLGDLARLPQGPADTRTSPGSR